MPRLPIFSFIFCLMASSSGANPLFECHEDSLVETPGGYMISYSRDTSATLDSDRGALAINLISKSSQDHSPFVLKSAVVKVEFVQYAPGTPGKAAGDFYKVRLDRDLTLVMSPRNEFSPWFHVLTPSAKILAESSRCVFDQNALLLLRQSSCDGDSMPVRAARKFSSRP